MDEEIIDRPLIDPDLSSYEAFFDHNWAANIFAAVDGTPLQHAVNGVIVAWRATNGAHILPWLMIESAKQHYQGEFEGSLSFRARYMNTVISGLVDKIEGLMQCNLKYDQQRALRRAVQRLEKDGYEAVKEARSRVQLDVNGYWKFLVNASEFQFSILGLQRTNYGSLFFAYEDFIANLIRTKVPTYSSKKTPIHSAFPDHFGKALAELCWDHAEVQLARRVRNAVAHNGGRFGTDLESFRQRFTDVTRCDEIPLRGSHFNLVDGKIQITPGNTAYLFGLLKERVAAIVENAR